DKVLLRAQKLLGEQYGREVHGALRILASDEIHDFLGGDHALAERRRAKQRTAVRRDRALDVRLRAEDTVRVLVDERLIFGVLYTNVVRDSPVVGALPAEGRATEGF